MSVRSGQILVYPRHIPPGVFVVLGGILLRGGESFDAAAGPFAIPGPDELGVPAAFDVVAGTDLEILFVPRSVALRDESLARLLEIAHLPIRPLQNGRAR
ncbi:MAG TPA: hypothetical protein VJ826_12255 [Candidatus Polarisedimenticolaceae bacterium]|nr:hypothetical protein [Candidatus Polarisedimenticolaceae bacterium]